jgi:Domain of unknown function (DUF4184)
MPFTPAHPAMVLPLLKVDRKYLSATGLIVGSMAPDFEYFIKMRINSNHSHTIAGLLYFDLPMTLALAFAFHGLVKRNLISNLPPFFQRRLGQLLDLDFKQYFMTYPVAFIGAALLGSFLHLFWDSFTHPTGFFVNRLPFYDIIVPFDGIKYPLYYALQTISTIIGLTVVGVYVLLLKPDEDIAVRSIHPGYWIFVLVIVVIMVLIRFGYNDTWKSSIETWVVSAISAICLALILAGFLKVHSSPA